MTPAGRTACEHRTRPAQSGVSLYDWKWPKPE